jgi:membrane protease YdiL (CAAX protease family)
MPRRSASRNVAPSNVVTVKSRGRVAVVRSAGSRTASGRVAPPPHDVATRRAAQRRRDRTASFCCRAGFRSGRATPDTYPMDQMVACPDCGSPNRSDAELCVQCWRGMSEDLASRIPVAAFAGATATATVPRPRVAPVQPPAPPPPPAREAAPGPVPYFAPLAEAPPAPPAAEPVAAPGRKPFRSSRVKWRWAHLWMVGACAWGVPQALTETWAPRFEGRAILDAALVIQIVGYVAAALVAAILVARVNNGDWSTVGIRWSDKAYDDVFRGAGFGLVMIGVFLAATFALSGGKLEVDGLVRLLVGGTSGVGFFLAAIVVVVGAPVIEEIYYRGMLYEKLGRWGRWPAMIVSTVLFVVAHGALIIPAIMFLGFGLAWKRQTKTLWYTMGGHAAWNLVVICLGVALLMGPSHVFSAPDGSYSLRHPAKWDRMGDMESTIADGGVDLALATPTGSFIAVGRSEVAPGVHRGNLESVLTQAQSLLPALPGLSVDGIRKTDLVRGGLVTAYETSMTLSDPTLGAGRVRLVAVLRDGAPQMTMLMVTCPQAECAAAEADFEKMAKSLTFSG